jgi:hypothetical protein
MSEEQFAVSKVAPTPAAQADYDAICAALMHTARGRWFLEEYARRNRSADTRLLLTAIERIGAVVCERNKQAQQGLRTDLLEMAQAITRTRAEVAEVGAEAASHPGSAAGADAAAAPPRPPQARDVFAAAERIRDVTWAMRGLGFDPATCDQLEELAASILSASALRDPSDHRANKLGEVLQYLERRIDILLESCSDGDAAAAEPAPEADRREAKPVNGFASPLVAAPVTEPIIELATERCEPAAADFEAEPASPPAPPIDLGGAASDARTGDEEVEVVDVEAEVIELDVVAVEAAAPNDSLSRDRAANSSPPQPKSDLSDFGHVSWQSRISPTLRAEGLGVGVVRYGTSAPHGATPLPSPPPSEVGYTGLRHQTGSKSDKSDFDWGRESTWAPPRPNLSPLGSELLSPKPEPAWAYRVPPAAAPPPQAAAASAAPSPPPPAQPAAAAALQTDPLAGLKAMSEAELIALFS